MLFNDVKEQLFKGVHDLSADTIKITLHTGYTPNIDTHQVWADAGVSSTEYSTASGYTAGGKTLGTMAVSQDDAGDRALWDAADVTWAALGALSPAIPSHAIIWNDTVASPMVDPLIGYIELGTTATNGGDYTLQFSSSPAAIVSLT